MITVCLVKRDLVDLCEALLSVFGLEEVARNSTS